MSLLNTRIARTAAVIVATGFLVQAAGDGTLAVTVTNPSGTPISGATVTISSPTQIGGSRTVLTDANGKVRFPRLSPGQFKVTFIAEGYQTQTMAKVDVFIDQTAAVNAKMVPVGGATVEVVSVAAQVDVTTVTQGLQLDAVQLESLPVARTQLAALTLAPGVVSVGGNPALTVGLNRDNFGGNGARNNTYMIDGVDVTSPEAGTGRTNIAPELVNLQDVKTGAITAEYTARAGLFSNVNTKVGGNEFAGGLTFVTQPTSFVGKYKDGTIDAGKQQISDYTLWALGPIIKDKLWYVISYQKRKDQTTVSLAPTATLTPGESRTGVDYDGYSIFAKLTWQIAPSDIFDFTFNSNPYEFDNLSSPGVLTRRAAKTEQGGGRWLAHYGHQWSSFFLDVRLSQHKEDNKALARYSDAGPLNNIKSFTALTPLQSQLGNSSALDERQYQKDRIRADGTWIFDAMGSHTLKLGFETGTDKLTQILGIGQGVQYESFDVGTYTWGNLPSSQARSFKPRVLNSINNTPALKAAFIAAGYVPTGTGGAFGSTDLNAYVFNEANPAGGFYEYRFAQVAIASSSPKMEIQGAYIQDQWQTGRWTFSPGFRFDKYTYKADNGQELFATGYNFAPRVGATFDVLGNGHSKAYAYWGRYIDPIKLDMVRFTGSLTSSVRTEDIRMLGQWILGNTRGGTKTVDAVFASNFKLPKTDELRIGYTTDFKGIYTLDATWTRRRDFDIVEDWDPTLYTDPTALEDEGRAIFGLGTRTAAPYASLSAKGQRIVNAFRALALPYEYFAGGGYSGQDNTNRVAGGTLNFVLANLPGGERKYQSFDLTLRRQEKDHWGGFASLSIVDAKGNSFSSGNADYQGDLAKYDPRLPYTNGHLDGSVDWLFKSNAYYHWDMGLMVGLTFNANSGYHYSTSDLVGTRILQAAPGIDEFDTESLGNKMSPRYYQFDLRVQYSRNIAAKVKGEVFLDIFNLFDRQNAIGLAEGTNVRAVQPVADAPYSFQLPRTFQVGFRLKF